MVYLKATWSVGVVLFVITIAEGVQKREAAAEWGYEPENGPLTWPATNPQCGGSAQSPININPLQAVNRLYPTRFLMFNHGQIPSSLNLTNNGHTVQGKATYQDTPYIQGGPLGSDIYVLEQFHFHWGSNNLEGSEHTFNQGLTRFPLEMHMVHWNKKYGSMASASTQPDGLAVVGVMFQLSPISNRLATSVANVVPQILSPGSTVTASPTPILSYPDPIGGNKPFYHYKGSLTTPPCSEVVTWIVYPRPLQVTASELQRLRSLRSSHGGNISRNFRNTQPRNGRVIEHVWPLFKSVI